MLRVRLVHGGQRSRVKTALIILNPRHVQRFEESLSQLPGPRIRLSGYTEAEIARGPWDDALRAAKDAGVTHLMATSDDLIIPPSTYDTLTTLSHYRPTQVLTGWANMDEKSSLAGLSDSPLTEPKPSLTAYDFPTWRDVLMGPAIRRTYFTGFVGTIMPLELWERYPFHAYTKDGDTSTDETSPVAWSSDYHMSRRLYADGVEIYAHRSAFCLHLKTETGYLDPYPPCPRRGVFWEEAS